MMRSLSKGKFCDCSMSSILGSEKTPGGRQQNYPPSIFKKYRWGINYVI